MAIYYKVSIITILFLTFPFRGLFDFYLVYR